MFWRASSNQRRVWWGSTNGSSGCCGAARRGCRRGSSTCAVKCIWSEDRSVRSQVEMFRRVLGTTLGFVGYTVQYGCIAHCAFEYFGEFVVCSGPSMEPTIVNHDIVFSERMSRHLCKIEKGDVVIAKSPFDPNMNICKRVIGLEGDKVCTSSPSDMFKSHTYVPKGHVWLEGDNLRNSSDSRSYGPIPYGLIRGRVCLKLWPPHSFGTLSESPTRRIIKTHNDSD